MIDRFLRAVKEISIKFKCTMTHVINIFLPYSRFLLNKKIKYFIDENHIVDQLYKDSSNRYRLEEVLKNGVKEFYLKTNSLQIDPNYLFDSHYFKIQLIKHGMLNRKAEKNLLKYYLQNFRKIPFTPSPYIDLEYLHEQYSNKIFTKIICAWADYYLNNKDKRRSPNANFNVSLYLARYRDILKSNIEPLKHYILYGNNEGRSAESIIDTESEELFLFYSKSLFFEKISNSKLESKIQIQFINENSENKNQSRHSISHLGTVDTTVNILQKKIYFSQNEIQPKILENKYNLLMQPKGIKIDRNFVDESLNNLDISIIDQPLILDLTEDQVKDLDSSDSIRIQKIILVCFLKGLDVKFNNKSILKYFRNIDPKIIEILKNQKIISSEISEKHNIQQSRIKQLLRYVTLECHTGILLPEIVHSKSNYNVKHTQNFFSIIITTNRPNYKQSILDNLSCQNYKNFEVLIALQPEYSDDDFSLMEKYLDKEKIDFKLFKTNISYPIGSMLNFLSFEAKYEYVTKFDDDDLYLENYLKHLNLDLNNLNFDVAGKYPEFIKFENDDFITHDPGPGSRVFDNTFNISGSSLTFRKSILAEISLFPEINRGEDELWRQNVYASGKRMIRLPGFDYIVRRHNIGHTWVYDEKEWKKQIYDENQMSELIELQYRDVDLSFMEGMKKFESNK